MSKSTKRRRDTLIPGVWVTPSEEALIRAKAKDMGVTIAELQRIALLGHKPPPRKVDREAMADALYELGKIGGNINQIAHHLNAGRPGDRIEETLFAALTELLEWRTMLMRAVGQERNRKPKKH